MVQRCELVGVDVCEAMRDDGTINLQWINEAMAQRPGFDAGPYVDTTDDRCDRWYIDPIDSDTWDRRGSGYRLLRIAKAAIDDPGRDYTED